MFWKNDNVVPLITAEELAGALATDSPPVLVDVRGPRDFAEGHLPAAVNIPLGELDARSGELDPAAATVFY